MDLGLCGVRMKLIIRTCVAGFALVASAGPGGIAADKSQQDDTTVPVRGVVRAIEQAQLSTDLIARVEKIGFRTGEAFKKGDLLIAFECERYRAEAQSAEAVWREMTFTLDSNHQLEKFRAVGRHDVEISKARVDKAEAETRSLKSRVSQCDIFAPYDGRVAELSINVYEQPQTNKPFLSIVGNGNLEVELIVPSNWLSWLKNDAAFTFRIDETARDYAGRVARIGASVDAVSQLVKVIAVLETQVDDVLPGMSGSASFTQPNG